MADREAPAGLADLERVGFLLVSGALDAETVAAWKHKLYDLHRRGLNEIDNSVGNVAFESLLRLEPELSRGLIGHPSVAPYLKAMLGRQCQLRSLRAHINPRAYRQEWHMDFADYHYQERNAGAVRPLRALCMNTTFYLTDNTPERGRLTFLNNYVDRLLPEELLPHVQYTDDRSNPSAGSASSGRCARISTRAPTARSGTWTSPTTTTRSATPVRCARCARCA